MSVMAMFPPGEIQEKLDAKILWAVSADVKSPKAIYTDAGERTHLSVTKVFL